MYSFNHNTIMDIFVSQQASKKHNLISKLSVLIFNIQTHNIFIHCAYMAQRKFFSFSFLKNTKRIQSHLNGEQATQKLYSRLFYLTMEITNVTICKIDDGVCARCMLSTQEKVINENIIEKRNNNVQYVQNSFGERRLFKEIKVT